MRRDTLIADINTEMPSLPCSRMKEIERRAHATLHDMLWGKAELEDAIREEVFFLESLEIEACPTLRKIAYQYLRRESEKLLH